MILILALLAAAGAGGVAHNPDLQPPQWVVLAIVLPIFILVGAGVAAIAFARSPLAQLPGPLWRVRPLVRLRTALSRRELVHRVTHYCEAQAAPQERRRSSIAAARIGSSTFRIEYADGPRRYVVRGRILEGINERLVLLRFDRPIRLWLAVGVVALIATAIWFGINISFDPSVLFMWLVLPLFGLLPADFFIPVSDELRDLLETGRTDVKLPPRLHP